jgi:uncharacterized protein (DUF2384 family)
MSSREVSQVPTRESILNHAREIFGEPRKVKSWMTTPNPFFRGMRPKDFIAYGNPQDLQMIMDELDRIDRGIY